ncbi:MAG: hypothetical protein AAF610_08645 [Pseudomonadota bacterium]
MSCMSWAIQTLLAVSLALTASGAAANTVLVSSMRFVDLDERQVLGIVDVPEVGKVTVSARRDKRRVIVLASVNGTVIGRGEGIVGIGSTTLHVKTGDYLEAIVVQWPAAAAKTGADQ